MRAARLRSERNSEASRPRRLITPFIALASIGLVASGCTATHAAPVRSREAVLSASAPAVRAVTITNTGSKPVTFQLTHNGHTAYTTLDEIVAQVKALPPEFAGEPIERKIWRFVRDNVYHESPINDSVWLHATWPVLNSVGWGFCSHVSAIYVAIAEKLGIKARIWNYGGHVAPEVFTGGAWHQYDPDLAVYYYGADGATVAGSEELQAHPELITAPVHRIFPPGGNDEAYRTELAEIYGSRDDNHVSDEFTSPEPFHGSGITLPPGAALVYPGRWTDPITGVDQASTYTVTQFREASLELSNNTTGPVAVPFLLRTVIGSGTVRINGRVFTAGSKALADYLVNPGGSVTSIEVVTNNGAMALVMLINPLWFDFVPRTTVRIDAMVATNGKPNTGTLGDLGAVTIAARDLDAAHRPAPPVPAELRKPVAQLH